MSWSGGTYTKSNAGTGGWTGDAVAGIAIDATRHDTQDNDFATGINQCLTKDGQNSCTADLNFGGFRPSNVAGGSAAAPAYTANNDTDTGAFSPASNAYAIATGGVERVRVDSSGFVGIGRTVPLVSLDVQGVARIGDIASSDFLINMGSTGVGTTRSAYINGAANNVIFANQQNGFMSFHTNNAERLRISATGEINVSTPSAVVNVGSAATSTQPCGINIGAGRTGIGDSYIDLVSDTTYSDYSLRIARYAGTNSDTAMEHRGTGALSITTVEAGFIKLSTSNIERLRITPAGTTQPGADNAYTLGANGVRWSAVWAANGTIQTSDEREKNTITESVLGLDFLKALRPVSYKWNVGGNTITTETDEDGNTTQVVTPQPGTRTHFGLIAQEVKAAIPDGVDFGGWVLTDKNNPDSQQALRYDQFIAPLIQAVKELSQKVQALEARIAVLEGA